MVQIDETAFARLRDKFEKEWNRINKYNYRPLTVNADLRIEYRENIVNSYNDIVRYLKYFFEEGTL